MPALTQFLLTCPFGAVSGLFVPAASSRTWESQYGQLHEPADQDLLRAYYVGEFDAISLVSVGTELKRTSAPAHSSGNGVRPAAHTLLPEFQSGDWEERFVVGETASTNFVDSGESAYSWREAWVQDPLGPGAVPKEMARAEEFLTAAEAAPAGIWKEKMAVRSLRMYHHARWLAERGHTVSAEVRFRESANLAKRSRRSILASHSLGRLGYFLVQWCRHDDAKVVLAEAEHLNPKSNPLAKYLHGVILRKEAVNSRHSNVEKLHAAEEKILAAQAQPSDELEAERAQLVQDIHFWHGADEDPWKCIQARDVAHAVICISAHLAFAVQKIFF